MYDVTYPALRSGCWISCCLQVLPCHYTDRTWYKNIQVLLDMGQCCSVNTDVSGQISVSIFKFDVHWTVHR
jgi:hypothetical protein